MLFIAYPAVHPISGSSQQARPKAKITGLNQSPNVRRAARAGRTAPRRPDKAREYQKLQLESHVGAWPVDGRDGVAPVQRRKHILFTNGPLTRSSTCVCTIAPTARPAPRSSSDLAFAGRGCRRLSAPAWLRKSRRSGQVLKHVIRYDQINAGRERPPVAFQQVNSSRNGSLTRMAGVDPITRATRLKMRIWADRHRIVSIRSRPQPKSTTVISRN